jgi:GNAT superfamily N-acetyltransferase
VDIQNAIATCAIREYRRSDDDAVHALVVALQDFERTIEPRLRPGRTIAEGYVAQIHARCRDAEGRIFVAEDAGAVVGFIAVLAREAFTELDDPLGTYALITDLIVMPSHRHQGIGRRLLERAEAFARDAGARELRIGVLAQNVAARTLYLDAAFVPYHETFAKQL